MSWNGWCSTVMLEYRATLRDRESRGKSSTIDGVLARRRDF